MLHADQPNKKTSNACGVIAIWAIWDTDVLVFFLAHVVYTYRIGSR
jgi:hypothetical protein